jgi:transcriptional regulator with XRE-family HTH domain
MAVHERRTDRGARVAVVLHRKLGQELRALRRQAGLSQRWLAAQVEVDHSVISRIEAGAGMATSLDLYARLFAVLGGKLSVKVYPEADPMRDEAHLRLIERLIRLLHAVIRVRREVPLGVPNDLRAWDLLLTAGGRRAAVEAEMVLDDLQALERKIALKQQDGEIEVVILLIADTKRNRRILAAHREALRARFPLDTRAALAVLRTGQIPSASAIIVL